MPKGSPSFSILSVKEQPDLMVTAANRIWLEWWKDKGKSEQEVLDGLMKALDKNPCHNGYVATRGGVYLGSALVIQSDMAERLNLTPWIAAVFVEPNQRGQGIGAALVRHATQHSMQHGVHRLYLCATPKNASFYERLGWKKIEENVGAKNLMVLQYAETPVSIHSHRKS